MTLGPRSEDPFNLARFVAAQEGSFECALLELRQGQKESHWMWYVFPQIDGLGSSPTAKRYAIKSKKEAEAYLQHPTLGRRLTECLEALLSHEGKSASEIMGFPDDLKLRSCMTLFATITEAGSVFHQVLDKYFQGRPDQKTLEILAREKR